MARKNRLWKKKPEGKDYDAARRFLSLIYPGGGAQKLVNTMRKANPVEHAAKDLLRASGLPLLPREDVHVKDDLKKLHRGEPLAPVLLVQGDQARQRALVVADGYHRICAICYYDEDAPVRCRIVKG